MHIPTRADVEAAAARIAPAIVATPLLRHDELDAATDARVYVKAESLQRFGAFKIRGAYNRIAAMSAAERANGVVAFSSGNHASAVAGAARLFGIPAVIVMPADAPRAKVDQTRRLGAEIVLYDRLTEDRAAIAARIALERGAPLVRPFDDPLVMAGQGTIGLEIEAALGGAPDIVAAPASGGGLIGGIGAALAGVSAAYAVEPAGHDDIAQSLAAGAIRANAPGVRSICDALLVEQMSDLTFAAARAYLAGAASVEDDAVRRAMRFAFAHLKLVLEPSGAIALAAALDGKLPARGKTLVIVVSGGNVDADAFAAVLGA